MKAELRERRQRLLDLNKVMNGGEPLKKLLAAIDRELRR